MAMSGLGTARWKVTFPLLPESGSVALTVRMMLPAGVCSGNVTWKRRKPQSVPGPPCGLSSQPAGLGEGLGLVRAVIAKVAQLMAGTLRGPIPPAQHLALLVRLPTSFSIEFLILFSTLLCYSES